MVRGLSAGERWIRTIGPATEKLGSGAPCGFRARLHQLGEALILRETKSSNPASSSGESTANRSRGASSLLYRRLPPPGGRDRMDAGDWVRFWEDRGFSGDSEPSDVRDRAFADAAARLFQKVRTQL